MPRAVSKPSTERQEVGGKHHATNGRTDDAVKSSRPRPNRGITHDEQALRQIEQLAFPPDPIPPSDKEVSKRSGYEVSKKSGYEASKKSGYSVQSVSALKRRLYELGRVEPPYVRRSWEESERARLAQQVCEAYARYGVRKVIVVKGYDEILDPLPTAEPLMFLAETSRGLVRAAAAFLDDWVGRVVEGHAVRQRQKLPERKEIVGVAGGRLMHQLAEYLNMSPRPHRSPRTELLEFVGIAVPTTSSHSKRLEPNVVAMDMAEAYGGGSSQLGGQAYIRRETADLWIKEPQIDAMLNLIRHTAGVVLFGMGPIVDTDEKEMTLSRDPEWNARILQDYKRAKAVADITGWAWTAEGTPVVTDYVTIGLGLNGLHEIASDPKRDRDTVLCVGGDRRRLAPLKVALQCLGIASVLIICSVTARYLLGDPVVLERLAKTDGAPPAPTATAA